MQDLHFRDAAAAPRARGITQLDCRQRQGECPCERVADAKFRQSEVGELTNCGVPWIADRAGVQGAVA